MSTDATAPKTRTITLTNRPPVKITDDAWPFLAQAGYHDYDGQYDFQATCHWRGWIRVRQHTDGRVIVYASCSHESAWQGSSGYEQKAGELLPVDTTTAQIIAAITRVHRTIDIVDEDHRDMWRLLADECIADLPAEEI